MRRRDGPHPRRRAGWAGALAAVLLAEGCASVGPRMPVVRPGDAPFGRVIRVRVDSGRVVSRSTGMLPPSARRRAPIHRSTKQATPKRERVHPLLARWLADSLAANPRVRVVVTLRDTLHMPRFPDPPPRAGMAPDSAALARTDALIAGLRSTRAKQNARFDRALAKRRGAIVLERFWIIRGLLVELPLADVPALVDNDDVVFVAPQFSGERPPVCGDGDCNPRCDQPWNASRQMNAARFRDVTSDGLDYGWLSLLDTGVRPTHEAFRELSGTGVPWTPNVGFLDCTQPDCRYPDAPSDRSASGHGTSSAAILVGFQNQNESGPNFCQRGLTRTHVHSVNVYGEPGTCSAPDPGLDRAAVLRTFELGHAGSGLTTVCEMQALGDDQSDIAAAAAAEYQAGVIMIAANGNCGSGCTPGTAGPCLVDCFAKAPANSPWVIGVGGYHVLDATRAASSSHCAGTASGRIKPDLLTPSNTYVAGNLNDTDYHPYTGSSGSAPYAGGVASLLRNYIEDYMYRRERMMNLGLEELGAEPIDPGHVYAALLVCGPDTWSASGAGFDPRRGVGPLTLPEFQFTSWFSKTFVTPTSGVDVTLDLTGLGASRVDAAIWWPDARVEGTFMHSVVELRLDGPDGAHAESLHPTSVFQRTGRAAVDGVWTMHIDPGGLPAGLDAQAVYYAVIAR